MKKKLTILLCVFLILVITGCVKKEKIIFEGKQKLKCNINLKENEVYDYVLLNCDNNIIIDGFENHIQYKFDFAEETQESYNSWMELSDIVNVMCDITEYTTLTCIIKQENLKINTCSEYVEYIKNEDIGKCQLQ